MEIEFDLAKNAKNIRERGLPFTLADEFDWTTAMIVPSSRHGEDRFFAIDCRYNRSMKALVFTKFRRNVEGHQPAPRPQDGGKTL